MTNASRRSLWLVAGLLFCLLLAAWPLWRWWFPVTGSDELRWGGDAAGGAPFIYGPPEDRVGFEVELAEYLGKQIGRSPRFVNGDWDAVPDTLNRGDIDIALNGFEYLPDREKEFPSTVPYFVYTLRLITRKNDDSIRDWKHLASRPGQPRKRVGVLRGSVAERYMRSKHGKDVEVVPTREVDETFQLVEGGERLDATVQDSPAAVYYIESGRLDKLRVVGKPVSPGYYVILTRKEDQALREKLNDALRKALRSGELERIYRKYHLWTPEQDRLTQLVEQPWPPSTESTPEQPPTRVSLSSLGGALARAAAVTVALACSAMPLAIALGIAVAVGRLYGPWLLRVPLGLYVEILRGTPLLLQLYVLFFLLPQAARWIGWQPLITLSTLPPFIVGVLGLAINYSAYESEIYRAGLVAIPRGQLEAALSLGMTRGTAVRRIILPQAIRLVVPPVTNDFIALFKDTSICSVILITDLTGLYYQNKYDRDIAMQLALVVGILYFAMSYPLSLLARGLERQQQSVHA
jgi:polar amino acid transport system substrate-binding protein